MLHAYLYHINIINEERKEKNPTRLENKRIYIEEKRKDAEKRKETESATRRWNDRLANKQAHAGKIHTATFYKVHNMILSHDTRYTPMSRCVGNTLERNLPLLG